MIRIEPGKARQNNQRLLAFLRRLRECRAGGTAIEYALVAALVSLAGFVAYGIMGDSLVTIFSSLHTSVDEVAQCVQVGSNCPK